MGDLEGYYLPPPLPKGIRREGHFECPDIIQVPCYNLRNKKLLGSSEIFMRGAILGKIDLGKEGGSNPFTLHWHRGFMEYHEDIRQGSYFFCERREKFILSFIKNKTGVKTFIFKEGCSNLDSRNIGQKHFRKRTSEFL